MNDCLHLHINKVATPENSAVLQPGTSIYRCIECNRLLTVRVKLLEIKVISGAERRKQLGQEPFESGK